jgi:glycosyl transferase family 25
MNVIVISLERAKERRERIKSQFEKLGIDGIIMDAVDGEKLSNIQKNKHINNPEGMFRNGEKFLPGEVGCLMSTINAINMARQKNWEYVIIMDDDVILSEDFKKGVNFLFRMVPPDWQHIFLGGHIYLAPAPVFQPSIVQSYFKISGSYCYILNKSAYNIVLNDLLRFELPVDDAFEKIYLKDQKIKSYIFFPFLAYPIQEHSYIWNTEGGQIHPSFKYFKNKL